MPLVIKLIPKMTFSDTLKRSMDTVLLQVHDNLKKRKESL